MTDKTEAILQYFPLRSGLGAPWKATFWRHNRITSHRYESKDSAIFELEKAGYRVKVEE